MNTHPKALIFDYSDVLFSPATGLNYELLLFLCRTVKKRFNLFILTASTGWQKPAIRLALLPIFARIFNTAQLGSKTDPQTFDRLSQEIATPVEQLLLIDNTPENIQAAKQAGGQGILFQNNQQLMSALREQGLGE